MTKQRSASHSRLVKTLDRHPAMPALLEMARIVMVSDRAQAPRQERWQIFALAQPAYSNGILILNVVRSKFQLVVWAGGMS
jgi:hypothetical protein